MFFPYWNLLLVVWLLFFPCSAQTQLQPVFTKGEATATLLPNETTEQLKTRLEKMAIQNALEKAFGTHIQQTNQLWIENLNQGENATTTSYFSTWAISKVTGKWIKTTQIDYTILQQHPLTLKCVIQGYALPLAHKPPAVQAASLHCPSLQCQTIHFQNESSFYFFFKANTAGYLALFIGNKDTVFRLLPYLQTLPYFPNGIPIQPYKDYIFFNPASDDLKRLLPPYVASYVDELILTADYPVTPYRLYVIFSVKPISLPYLTPPFQTDNPLQIPPFLPMKTFDEWLFDLQSHEEQVYVLWIDINVYQQP
jgi:hypothetical protein